MINVQSRQDAASIAQALHESYIRHQPYVLEPLTSIVTNTWLAVRPSNDNAGPIIDMDLAEQAWDHARRREENGCVVLGSLHATAPSMLGPFCQQIPFPDSLASIQSFHRGLELIQAFTHRATPHNPSAPQYSSLAVTFDLFREGDLMRANFKLPQDGLDVVGGLLNVPAQPGNRAFHALYYLNNPTASESEREVLALRPYLTYHLLNKSGSVDLPAYMGAGTDEEDARQFRANLRHFSIPVHLLVTLSGLLTLGDALHESNPSRYSQILEDAAAILDVDTTIFQSVRSSSDLGHFISGLYSKIVGYVISNVNRAINSEIASKATREIPPYTFDEDNLPITLSVVDIPSTVLAKAVAFRVVFDNEAGINGEMRDDGIQLPPVNESVLYVMRQAIQACAFDVGMTAEESLASDSARSDVIAQRDYIVSSALADLQSDSSGFLYKILSLPNLETYKLMAIVESSRVWFQGTLSPFDTPAGVSPSSLAWEPKHVSAQVLDWSLVDWVNRRMDMIDFTADYGYDEFSQTFQSLGCPPFDGDPGPVKGWVGSRGWDKVGVVFGKERIWVHQLVWKQAYNELDGSDQYGLFPAAMAHHPYGTPFADAPGTMNSSHDDMAKSGFNNAASMSAIQRAAVPGDYGLGTKGDNFKGVTYAEGEGSTVLEEVGTTRGRRVWVAITWAFTWWMPSFLLSSIGRMKRPDVRMAWREKLALVLIIILMNGIVVFYIIAFGRLLCPNFDKAWNTKEVSTHQGRDDFYVSHAGYVYDLSKFWRLQHSDTAIETTNDLMQPFGGIDVTPYIRPPLVLACPDLVTDKTIRLLANNTLLYPQGTHDSGTFFQADITSKLNKDNWYTSVFLPRMLTMRKGDLVWKRKEIAADGDTFNRPWFIIEKNVYDMTDYFHTNDLLNDGDARYQFMDPLVKKMVTENPGTDITDLWYKQLNKTAQVANRRCLNNFFYVGKLDFRTEAQCKVNSYILLAVAIILCIVIGVKFLAALQLGSKRQPSQQDKFVICQVPAYTEGEESIRQGLDSLTALHYDNKRKLILVISDGVIIGAGNDRPTPKIVLDILGVDPKTDPPALPFYSIGNGSEKLNYGKVYSGLYEYEGNVVPYLVVVKVGKESEQKKAKPGNRGKRDSQVLLMRFLNRVHFRSPMNPLELEMFHQLNNVIGVDPELYEFVLMVDADTTVVEDSLNRLVASCVANSKIAGICGETSLQNEGRSWWTMIQVYEYYISHHLSKAFESLFGSVTCLPGCFSMYRLRTADKGKPLIISDGVISEYEDAVVDTLHKKNLLSLGEDRYLTTLMTKHFPSMSYKFIPDAFAYTAAPETWSVLLSQRRRWINSTIHNLAELMFLKNMCGFCCFSMRFVVFIDLFGTIILPATCVYLGYLIYTVASGTGPLPVVSLIMLAAVYGLQAIIFILKRQWQHIGWMIIYILAFPIFSFVLPMYSFWKQDDFSWGNTRRIIEEKGSTKVVATDDEGFDPRSIPLQSWNNYAEANNLPGRRGDDVNDEIKSAYSSAKPSSLAFDMMASPAPLYNRQSSISQLSFGQQVPSVYGGQGNVSAAHLSVHAGGQVPRQSFYGAGLSADNLVRSGGGPMLGRPTSTVHMENFGTMSSGPTDAELVEAVTICLRGVDLDTATKKQLRNAAMAYLKVDLPQERKARLDRIIDDKLLEM